MKFHRLHIAVLLNLSAVIWFAGLAGNLSAQEGNYRPGLAGRYYNSQDFTDPDQSVDVLTGLAHGWQKSRGNEWSGRWSGFIEGPFTGEVRFMADAVDKVELKIDGQVIIDDLDGGGTQSGVFPMRQGFRYPVEVSFISMRGKARLFLFWQWEERPKTIVPDTVLSHDASLLSKGMKRFDFDSRWTEEEGPPPGSFETGMPAFAGGSPPYADEEYHDGRFRPAVGTHNFQVIRSNRSHPENVTHEIPSFPDVGIEDTGFTYNHQPYLAYWKGRFYGHYLSGPVHEHQQPCYALITWSEDGRNWAPPRTLFPARRFRNRKHDDAMEYSISHQRMGWYVAPDGSLLASAFYGMDGTPNDGKGVGRVVREVFGPDEFGPIYWIRYNQFQGYSKEDSPHYPYFSESPDTGFVEAVDALLADKLVVQQWWEEEQGNEDGFFPYAGGSVRYLKAFNYYTRPDGKIVGLWKWKKMAVANAWESGEISRQGVGAGIYYGGAKIWGHRLPNDRYALVYNPVLNTTWRHPLSITTSDDGEVFDTYFLNVHSETPLMRFGGENKDGGGGQYVRGIWTGNGSPPDGALWLIYSSNKEDIFVTRVPVPVTGVVDEDVQDDFEDVHPDGIVKDWNIYSGIWNPVRVIEEVKNNVLRLEDEDPYDYAKAVRVFPETTKARVSFDLRLEQIGHDNLEIEIQNYKGQRPVRIVLVGRDGEIVANDGAKMEEVAPLVPHAWLHLDIEIDTVAGEYDLLIDGQKVFSEASFAERLDNQGNPYASKFETPTVERIVFRTGIYRMQDFSRYGFEANNYRKYEPDLPGADEAVEKAVFDVDNFETFTSKPKE